MKSEMSIVIPTGLHTQKAFWIMKNICYYHDLQKDLRGTRLAQWWPEIAQWSKILSNYDIALASESDVSDYEVVLFPHASIQPWRCVYCQEAEANVMLVDEMAPSSDGAKMLLSSLGDIILEYCRHRLVALDAEADAFYSIYNSNEYAKDFITYDPNGYSLCVEINGTFSIPFSEVEVLCHALKGQTDQLSDDELAYIVGSKLDLIALEALSQIESQMNDLESEAQRAFDATGSMSTYYHKIDKLRSEAKNIRKKAVEACIKRREGAAA